jgi:LacI family transcriptional regulator
MNKSVRLSDVALAANTSAKTASLVINGDPRVSPDTKKRVNDAIEKLGYRVDLLARSLRKGVDEAIGVVVPSIGDPFFAAAIEAIEQVALQRDIQLIISSNHNEPEKEIQIIQQLEQRRVSGMIITPNQADYSFMKNRRTPIVFFDRLPRNYVDDVVLVEDIDGAQLAIEHLIKHGHRRIVFISDTHEISTARLRFEGYKRALKKNNISFDSELVTTAGTESNSAHAEITNMFKRGLDFTAIFSSRSAISIGVVKALHEMRRTDIAFVSFGDFELAEVLTPHVSVIDHSPADLGRLAANRLLAKIDRPVTKKEVIYSSLNLIERGSGELPLKEVDNVRFA